MSCQQTLSTALISSSTIMSIYLFPSVLKSTIIINNNNLVCGPSPIRVSELGIDTIYPGVYSIYELGASRRREAFVYAVAFRKAG